VKTLDESASSLGASPLRRFLDVIVPNARPGILAGSLMVVTLSLGEFNLTWMLHTPLTKTLPLDSPTATPRCGSKSHQPIPLYSLS
jgi:putative spermidine/putrescine transport system permease protein